MNIKTEVGRDELEIIVVDDEWSVYPTDATPEFPGVYHRHFRSTTDANGYPCGYPCYLDSIKCKLCGDTPSEEATTYLKLYLAGCGVEI